MNSAGPQGVFEMEQDSILYVAFRKRVYIHDMHLSRIEDCSFSGGGLHMYMYMSIVV